MEMNNEYNYKIRDNRPRAEFRGDAKEASFFATPCSGAQPVKKISVLYESEGSVQCS